MQHSDADKVAQVLSLVVPNAVAQQSAFGQPLLDVRDVCRMIQTSSAIQQALQHTPAELHVAMFRFPDRGSVPPARREEWLASFADWILKHRSLVNSVSLETAQTPLAEQQLGTLLRMCRLLPPGDGLPPLRLQVFRAWTVPKPAFLRELAGFQLQELSIGRVEPLTPHIAAFGAMLRQLTSLRSLELSAPFSQSMLPSPALADDCVMSAIEHLTCLTHLDMKGLRPECAAQLPAGLECLDIGVVGSTSNCDVVDLRHLTALTQLCWSDNHSVVAELALPSRLTTLGAVDDVAYDVPARLTGGCGLRLLPVSVSTGDVGIRFLSSVPGLVGLSELRVFLQSDLDLSPYTAGGLAQAAAALGAATQLTRLALGIAAHRVPVVDWCGPLSRLPQLRSLVLFGVPVCQQGVLELPSLTSLTPVSR